MAASPSPRPPAPLGAARVRRVPLQPPSQRCPDAVRESAPLRRPKSRQTAAGGHPGRRFYVRRWRSRDAGAPVPAVGRRLLAAEACVQRGRRCRVSKAERRPESQGAGLGTMADGRHQPRRGVQIIAPACRKAAARNSLALDCRERERSRLSVLAEIQCVLRCLFCAVAEHLLVGQAARIEQSPEWRSSNARSPFLFFAVEQSSLFAADQRLSIELLACDVPSVAFVRAAD